MRLETDPPAAGLRPRASPHLLINEPTLQLLDDLFGCGADLRAHAHAIRGRLVCWDRGEADLVDEPGLALAGTTLHGVLAERLSGYGSVDTSHSAAWTIEARGRRPHDADDVIVLGDRVAISAAARLRDGTDPSLCAVEAVADGWLFLLPLGGDGAVIQAVVPQRPSDLAAALDGVLAQSRLVARLIAARADALEVFACAPRLRPAPARRGWMAAGDAALAFDPLCGDGTGQALRCGLLAGAVIAAIARGEPEAACLTHYRQRLRRAMRAHLNAVIAFYAMAPCHDLWEREIARARQALDPLAADDVHPAAPTRYRLERLSLVPASA
ncbi:MAG TPA: hypothetical protein VKE26_06110 [Xanthobacteraceae bacterium]|nr:hypothetical protein [Xanthobacteraceae bacterium]